MDFKNLLNPTKVYVCDEHQLRHHPCAPCRLQRQFHLRGLLVNWLGRWEKKLKLLQFVGHLKVIFSTSFVHAGMLDKHCFSKNPIHGAVQSWKFGRPYPRPHGWTYPTPKANDIVAAFLPTYRQANTKVVLVHNRRPDACPTMQKISNRLNLTHCQQNRRATWL